MTLIAIPAIPCDSVFVAHLSIVLMLQLQIGHKLLTKMQVGNCGSRLHSL